MNLEAGAASRALSIRSKLILGTALIAALTILTAITTAYEAHETSRQISRIEEAQARIEQLAQISGRISDYAITAVDSVTEDFSTDRATERLGTKSNAVHAVFNRSQQLILQDSEPDISSRRLLANLAQMEALFKSMDMNIRDGLLMGTATDLSASLNMFSSQFSPLLGAAINAEQTKRQDAVSRIGKIRYALSVLSVAVILLTLFLLILFNMRIIGPIVSRIGRIDQATKSIASGDFKIDLPTDPADELGKLFGRTNLMAEELNRTKARVDEDRNQLNEIIAARTLELTQANQRLSQIDAHRRRFFADVSHELRTPLTVILAEAELSQGAPQEDIEESLKVILTRARKLNQRIDDLLRVARSESGQIELNLRDIGLDKIASEAAEDMTPHLRKKSIQLDTHIDTVGQIIADIDWIRQVISGLIENSIKHTPDGSTISLTVFEHGNNAVVEITDQGSGLDPDFAQSAFERFRKGQSEAAQGGFGIGLSLAKWVVEEHGGTIELHDGKDKQGGLKVIVRLPLAPEKPMLAENAP